MPLKADFAQKCCTARTRSLIPHKFFFFILTLCDLALSRGNAMDNGLLQYTVYVILCIL